MMNWKTEAKDTHSLEVDGGRLFRYSTSSSSAICFVPNTRDRTEALRERDRLVEIKLERETAEHIAALAKDDYEIIADAVVAERKTAEMIAGLDDDQLDALIKLGEEEFEAALQAGADERRREDDAVSPAGSTSSGSCSLDHGGWTCSAPGQLRGHVRTWCGHCQDALRRGMLLRGPDHGDLLEQLAAVDCASVLPSGWTMQLRGYAVDHGQSKSERKSDGIVRMVDARGGRVMTWAEDGLGVPREVVEECIRTAPAAIEAAP